MILWDNIKAYDQMRSRLWDAGKAPLCKGSWHGEAVTEGLCRKAFDFCCKLMRIRSACVDNPSASHSLGTSPCTGEAWAWTW